MSNNININQQIVDDPEFAKKPVWAKCLYFYLWCKADFAGFVDIRWDTAKLICNIQEELTDEDIWKGLQGFVIPISGTSVAYMKDFIITARAQKGKVSSKTSVHLKIYKDMLARKLRFNVADPVSIIRENNPSLILEGLSTEIDNKQAKEDSAPMLFAQLGIPKAGLPSFNLEQAESVSVSDNNKPSEVTSYTQQDDGIEDIFEPVQQERKRFPDEHPDQSKPILAITQERHEEWIKSGHYMENKGHYVRLDGQDIRLSFEEREKLKDNKPLEPVKKEESDDPEDFGQF